MKFSPQFSAMLCAVAAASMLSGCAAVAVGGAAAATGLVATDRRSADTQLADKTIDARAADAVSKILDDKGHVAVTSYYRKALITGEVPTAEDRTQIASAVRGVSGVQSVINELAVAPNSSLSQRATDTYLTGRVKSALIGTEGVPSNSIKVLTARGTVYLMGRLTQQETELATNAARTVPGVQRVVRVIDTITPEEALHPSSDQQPSGPAPVTSVEGTQPAAAPAASTGVESHPVGQSPEIKMPPVEVTPLPPAK